MEDINGERVMMMNIVLSRLYDVHEKLCEN